ncbi:MAG: polysaccharide deacetylase family protein [Bacteroidales bacterium]|nr:polysaccharide deacetylase family protein [Bacteroidales bacterium]
MLLIHIPRLTNRVGYTLNVLFRYLLKVDFEITTDTEIFENHDGPKLCYGRRKIGDCIFVSSVDLLFQTTIEEQNVRFTRFNDMAALIPTYNSDADIPFDIFAASFYCLSRYEEYLPHLTDSHGRFPASESIAFKNGFLSSAVVDRWALLLVDTIRSRYRDFIFPMRTFDYEDTFDIDSAYCYKHKGLIRSVGGFGRDLFSSTQRGEIKHRLKVLLRREPDPFDVFDYILDVHYKYPAIRLKFFPLMGDYNVNDKSISYQNREFRQLLQHLGDYAKIGIHSSYASHDDHSKIAVERDRLSSLLHREITRNRNHFLRLTIPASYNALIYYGILHDYTMGYADEPGFRAGTGNPYPFFDIESDCETSLIIHPFVVMDSTLFFYKHLSVKDAESVYLQLIDESKAVGGVFSALWHNQTLSEKFGWQGWRTLYEKVLQYANPTKNE